MHTFFKIFIYLVNLDAQTRLGRPSKVTSVIVGKNKAYFLHCSPLRSPVVPVWMLVVWLCLPGISHSTATGASFSSSNYDTQLVQLVEDALQGSPKAIEELKEQNNSRTLEYLVGVLYDEDDLVRDKAAELLIELDNRETTDLLIENLGNQFDDVNRTIVEVLDSLGEPLGRLIYDSLSGSEESQNELAELTDPRVITPLIRALDHLEKDKREMAQKTLVALQDARVVDPLIRALNSSRQHVRMAAVKLLGKTGDERAVEPLLNILQNNSNSDLMEAAIWGLSELNDPRAIDTLVLTLFNGTPSHRVAAAWALSNASEPRVFGLLIDALEDEQVDLRMAAAGALGERGDYRATPYLIDRLLDPRTGVRLSAVWSLGKLKDPQAIEPLIYSLEDESRTVQEAAAWTLTKFDDDRISPIMIDLLSHADPETRKRAANKLDSAGEEFGVLVVDALGGSEEAMRELQIMADPRATIPLQNALGFADVNERRNAAITLGKLGDDSALSSLTKMAGGWNLQDRFIAMSVLSQLIRESQTNFSEIIIPILIQPSSITYIVIIILIIYSVYSVRKKISRARKRKHRRFNRRYRKDKFHRYSAK